MNISMDKIIIFGMGEILKKQLPHMDVECIVAFCDNSVSWGSYLGKPIIKACMIPNFSFSHVVIFTNQFRDEIYKQLTEEIGIKSNRILLWKDYLLQTSLKEKAAVISLPEVAGCLRKMKGKTVLDVGMVFLRANTYTSTAIKELELYPGQLDGISLDAREDHFLQWNLYRNIYHQVYALNDAIEDKIYDVAILSGLTHMLTKEAWEVAYIWAVAYAECVILTVPYGERQDYERIMVDTQARICRIAGEYEEIYLVYPMREREHFDKDTKIFIMSHGEQIPPLEVVRNQIYIPINLTATAESPILSDDTGEHIRQLNPVINECTGLYWLWRNMEGDYIGLCHYRRYFMKNDVILNMTNILEKQDIAGYMKEYDIIIPQCVFMKLKTVKTHLRETVTADAFETGWQLILTSLKKNQPDYLTAFYHVMNGQAFYPCNMFVTRKEIMDRYCEWLFSIILEPANRIDILAFDSYSRRIIGFFAERLLTVWLLKQDIRIKELPVLVLS